eukprot:TRINITY_DN648_c2_g1_i4.p1 TRINITY_DN648_c2_g1~~TRINITY_DN648_c2_g1_i4.p1  ORF type:complete len:1354 (-),score=400.81 TRINITY_DN648_c2_g1_i4:226-4287(-)
MSGGMNFNRDNKGRGGGHPQGPAGRGGPAGLNAGNPRRPSQEAGGMNPQAMPQNYMQRGPGPNNVPNFANMRTSSAPPDMKEQQQAHYVPQKGFTPGPNPNGGHPGQQQGQNWQNVQNVQNVPGMYQANQGWSPHMAGYAPPTPMQYYMATQGMGGMGGPPQQMQGGGGPPGASPGAPNTNVGGSKPAVPSFQPPKKSKALVIIDPTTKTEVKAEKIEKKGTDSSAAAAEADKEQKPEEKEPAASKPAAAAPTTTTTTTPSKTITLSRPDGEPIKIEPRSRTASQTSQKSGELKPVEIKAPPSTGAAAPASQNKTGSAVPSAGGKPPVSKPPAGKPAEASGTVATDDSKPDAKKDAASTGDKATAKDSETSAADDKEKDAKKEASAPPEYPEGTWSPDNPKGKMMYSRDFLMKFKKHCTTAPEGLPPIEVIVGAETDSSNNDSRGHGRQSFHGSRGSGGFNRNSPDHRHQHNNRGSRDNNNYSGRNDRRDNRGKGRRKNQPGGPTIPMSEVKPLEMSETRWKPSKLAKNDQVDKVEEITKKTKALLNKLTVEKFDSISDQILDVGITSAEILRRVISLIFDKALGEPNFSTMYAELCLKMAAQLPEFKNPEDMDAKGRPQTFKRILLNQCQEEFEKMKPEKEVITDEMKEGKSERELEEMEEEVEYRFMLSRKRMLGNVKFIGELYIHRMLTEKIMNECIRRLLGDITQPDEDKLEAMCQLITTIGKVLDNSPKSEANMQAYFEAMQTLSVNKVLPSRIRFMIKDVIDLRARKWIPRRKEEKAKNLDQIRAEAIRAQEERDGKRRGGGNDFRHGSRGGRDDRGGSGDFRNRGSSGPTHSMPPMARGQPRNNQSQGKPGEWELAGSRGTSRDSLRDHSQRPTRHHSSAEQEVAPMGFRPGGPGGGLGSGAKGWTRDSAGDQGGSGNMFSLLGDKAGGEGRDKASSNEQGASAAKGPAKKGGNSASSDNASPPAKPGLSEEQLRKKTEGTLNEYLSIHDKAEATLCVKEWNAPDFHSSFVEAALTKIMEAKAKDAELVGELLVHLNDEEVLSTADICAGFDKALEILPDVSIDAPMAEKFVCEVLAQLIDSEAVPLDYITSPGVQKMDEVGGNPANFAACTLNKLKEQMGEEDLRKLWLESEPDLTPLFPEDRRSLDELHRFAEFKGLLFLYPELGAIKALQVKVNEGASSEELIDYMTENADVYTKEVLETTAFASKLTTIVLERVASLTIFKDTTRSAPNQPTDELKEEERKLLSQYTRLLRRVLAPELQCAALFAIQVFCYEANWPVGLMERIFHHMYDLDVVFEEAFTQWKEDETVSQPGKVKALFQVNRFLQWLDEAEEESDDEEDEDDE